MNLQQIKEKAEKYYDLPLVVKQGCKNSCFKQFTTMALYEGYNCSRIGEFLGKERWTPYRAYQVFRKLRLSDSGIDSDFKIFKKYCRNGKET